MTTTASLQIDEKRLGRAHAILAAGGVKRIDESTYEVSSQTGSGHHLVTQEGPEGLMSLRCTCPDFMGRSIPEEGLFSFCKHCLAVALSEGWLDDDPPPPMALRILDTGDEEGEEDDFAIEFEEVTSRLQADALLWQLGKLEAEIQEINALAAAEIAQIQRWQEREGGKLEERATAFSAPLKAFLRREERKSLRLPHGELKLRKLPDKIIVHEEVFNYNREEFIRVIPEKREPDLPKIKKHLKATGELLVGVDLQLGEQKFTAVAKCARKEVVPTKKEAA